MSPRIHNILFALIITAILAATAYVLHAEAPSLTFAGYAARVSRAAEDVAAPRGEGETERMIDAGELSDHPAKYYKVIEE